MRPETAAFPAQETAQDNEILLVANSWAKAEMPTLQSGTQFLKTNRLAIEKWQAAAR